MAKGKPIKVPSAEDSKRQSILNAAIFEFCSGYEKASTDAIVKSAGVSKGLLFHYFGTKKKLYLYAYEYAIQIVMAEFYDLINYNEGDILQRLKQIALLKMDLMQKYPMIFNFIAHASFPDSKDLKSNIMELRDKITNDVYPKLFCDIDRTLFREDIDVDTAISTIFFTIEGYAQGKANPNKTTADYYSEYAGYLCDLERYLQLFRMSFYKWGEFQ